MIAAAITVFLGFLCVSANAQLLLSGDTWCLLKTCGPPDGAMSIECNTICVGAGFPSGTCTVTLIDNGSTAMSNCSCSGNRNSSVPNAPESLCLKADCAPTCLICGYQEGICVQNPAGNGGGCVCTDRNPNSLLGLLRILG